MIYISFTVKSVTLPSRHKCMCLESDKKHSNVMFVMFPSYKICLTAIFTLI